MAKLIPMRPVGAFRLSQAEQNCLTWYVLSGCKRDEAFAAFVRPDLAGNPSILTQYSSQFFASQPATEYVGAYTTTLEAVLHPKPTPVKKLSKEEQDKRNAEAVQKVVDWVIGHSDTIDSMEHPEELIKMMQRLGMLSDDTVTEEAPRRYLSEMCSQCRYRAFVEQECDDECDFCKYRKYAEENGVHYNPEQQLNK